jgi:hypothetical protein
MAGTYRSVAEPGVERAFHFKVEVDCPDVSKPLRGIDGIASGRLTMEGVAEDVEAHGTLRIAPFLARTIEYHLSYTVGAKQYRFDGAKQIDWLRPLRTWTTLPGKIYDRTTGEVVADVLARFSLQNDFVKLLRSLRPANPARLADRATSN